MRTRTTKSVLLALAFAVFTPRANAQTWASGEYRYDGAGNIVSIRDRAYGYDAAGRLTKAQVGATYEYEYDAYGNRTAYVVNQQRVTVPVVSATNHLADAAYDAAGNQRSRGATAATFDGFGMMTSHRFDAVNAESFVYTANDERNGVLRGTEWTWSLRDPAGRVLRQYRSSATQPGAPWLWVADFVYRGSLLLGSEHAPSEGGRRHHHLDHLGSPRLVTSDAGSTISEHDFLPFGEERTPVGQPLAKGFDREEPHRFTGHERDFDTPAPSATSAYVDSMHARYYAAKTGRFLSVDPEMNPEKIKNEPQQWNRYTYVTNNPLKYTDPDGKDKLMAWLLGDAFRDVSTWDALKGALSPRPVMAAVDEGRREWAEDHRVATGGLSPVPTTRGEVAMAPVFMMLGPAGGAVRTTLAEAKVLVGAWGKGTFPTIAKTIAHHFEKHGAEVGAKSVLQYMRKAFEFNRNLRGAQTVALEGGATRYIKNGYYIIKDEAGRILSYGRVTQ